MYVNTYFPLFQIPIQFQKQQCLCYFDSFNFHGHVKYTPFKDKEAILIKQTYKVK